MTELLYGLPPRPGHCTRIYLSAPPAPPPPIVTRKARGPLPPPFLPPSLPAPSAPLCLPPHTSPSPDAPHTRSGPKTRSHVPERGPPPPKSFCYAPPSPPLPPPLVQSLGSAPSAFLSGEPPAPTPLRVLSREIFIIFIQNSLPLFLPIINSFTTDPLPHPPTNHQLSRHFSRWESALRCFHQFSFLVGR